MEPTPLKGAELNEPCNRDASRVTFRTMHTILIELFRNQLLFV